MAGGRQRVDRIELSIAVVLQLGILIVTIGSRVERAWLTAFAGAVVLLLTFAPAIIERKLRLTLPVEFTLVTCVFLYASFILGEVRDFYERIWWWDLALHGLSALTIGVIGFLSIYVFWMTRRVRVAAGWIATITFAIAVSVGTVWEIFEFLMDWYFGFEMQSSGHLDTMTDLIINAIGAAIAAAFGYFYVYDKDSDIVRRMLDAIAARRDRMAKTKRKGQR